MRPIRVALVVRPATGGIKRHVSSLAARLDRSEFAPALFAPSDFQLDEMVGDLPRFSTAIGAKTSPLADFASVLRLSIRLRGRYDLVHAHGIRAAAIAVPAARIAGIPALVTAHNLLPPCGRLARAVLQLLRGNSTFIAVSNAVAASLAKLGGGGGKLCHVIPNGVDVLSFDPPVPNEAHRRQVLAAVLEKTIWNGSLDSSTWMRDIGSLDKPLFIIGAIGRLAPEKGFDILIEAFAEWSANIRPQGSFPMRDRQTASSHRMPDSARPDEVGPDTQPEGIDTRVTYATEPLLIIAGCGPEENRLIELARDVPGIILTGAMADVRPLLHTVDMVAVPSREEGQGIVALEAMAARKPVAASSVGGLPETITNGKTGLLVPPGDPSALAAAIGRLAESPALRRQLGDRGRERVEQLFTLDAMIGSISALYRETAREKR